MLLHLQAFVFITASNLVFRCRAESSTARILTEKGYKGRVAFVGESIRLSCVPPGAKYNLGLNVTYEWFRSGRMSFAKTYKPETNGDLVIDSVAAHDSEPLTCKAHVLGSDTEVFNHNLMVIDVPHMDITVISQYQSGTCHPSFSEFFRKEITKKITAAYSKLCNHCEDPTIDIKCKQVAKEDARIYVTVTLEVRVKQNIPCAENCPKQPTGPNPEESRKFLHKVLKDITLETSGKKFPFIKLKDEPEREHCAKGFKNESNLCHPCHPGTYLSDPSTCSPCPRDSYSSSYAAVECESCPPGETTTSEGKETVYQCLVFDSFTLFLVIFLILFFIIFLPCCAPPMVCFYFYYKKVVRETGEEPFVVQKLRQCCTTTANAVNNLFYSSNDQNTLLSEVSTPLLSDGGFVFHGDVIENIQQTADISARPPQLPSQPDMPAPTVTTQPQPVQLPLAQQQANVNP